jgi:superfamily II helicase
MKVIIEIEKDEEIEKVRKAFKGQTITVVKARKDKNKILDAIFKKYNVKLPKNYTFDREAVHAR